MSNKKYLLHDRAYHQNSARERPPQSKKNIVDVTAECKLSWFWSIGVNTVYIVLE